MMFHIYPQLRHRLNTIVYLVVHQSLTQGLNGFLSTVNIFHFSTSAPINIYSSCPSRLTRVCGSGLHLRLSPRVTSSARLVSLWVFCSFLVLIRFQLLIRSSRVNPRLILLSWQYHNLISFLFSRKCWR